MVEATSRDRLWGISLDASNPKAQDKNNWRGKNWLGYVLTDVRDEHLAKEEANVGDSNLVVESGNNNKVNIDDTDTEESEKCSENGDKCCEMKDVSSF